MSHLEVARAYSLEVEQDPNNLSLIMFGSVARGTFRPDSDLDFLLLKNNPPKKSWEDEFEFRGIKVGTHNLDYDYFRDEVIQRPFNRIVLIQSQVMFDKTGNVSVWIGALNHYFDENADIKAEWDRLGATYKEAKTNPNIEPANIYDIYLQFARRYRGRTLQQPIP